MDTPTPQNPNLNTKQDPKNSLPDSAQPQIYEDVVFFNVMPKSNSQSALVEPKMKVEESEELEVSAKNNFFEILKKYKLYLGVGLAVLILGIGIYFLVTQLGSGGYKTEDLLVKQPTGQMPNLQPQSPQITAQPGFTAPKTWMDKYFPGCTDSVICGDEADPDNDGLSNIKEYELGTDPNNPDSDQDGLADGDEVNIFATDPLNSHTAKNPKYSDADFFKGGFDLTTNAKLTSAQILAFSGKMRQSGLHQPTIITLNSVLGVLYKFSVQNSTTTAVSTLQGSASSTNSGGLDESVEAKQGRDAQRSETIKNLEIALVKYQSDNQAYPATADFNVMYSEVKLYLRVATNPIDPINKAPYVYSYISNASSSDFSLSFYSEVAGQPISKNAAAAIKVAGIEQSAIYDNQRETDLESIRTALLLYSQNNVAGNQDYVFPTKNKYKTAIVPQYISVIPVDPKTKADYTYEVSPTFNTFTLKALLDNPPSGTTGYMCNQDSCQNY
jgi:hypothetical protein